MILFGLAVHDEMESTGFYKYVEENICPVTDQVKAQLMIEVMKFLHSDPDMHKYILYTEDQQDMKELWELASPVAAHMGVKFYRYALENKLAAERAERDSKSKGAYRSRANTDTECLTSTEEDWQTEDDEDQWEATSGDETEAEQADTESNGETDTEAGAQFDSDTDADFEITTEDEGIADVSASNFSLSD